MYTRLQSRTCAYLRCLGDPPSVPRRYDRLCVHTSGLQCELSSSDTTTRGGNLEVATLAEDTTTMMRVRRKIPTSPVAAAAGGVAAGRASR
jgi:hypothetical protein